MKKFHSFVYALLFVAVLVFSIPAYTSAAKSVPVTSIKLNKTAYLMLPKKKVTLKATIKPSDATNKKITWTSSNKKIAKVSSKGVVTSVAHGTTTIYAKSAENKKILASCTIYVLMDTSTPADTNTNTNTNTNVNTDTSTGTNTSALTPSAKAKQFIKYLEKYSDTIASERANGIDWIYQNGGSERIFADAIGNNKRYANCALIATWGLHDVGILSGKTCIYGLPYGDIKFSGKNTEACIRANCDIIPTNNATIRELVADQKIIPGDICIYNFGGSTGHTNIFNGYDAKKKIYHFFDAGRNGQNCVKGSDGKYHFSSLKQTSSSGGNSVTYIIRIK